MKPSDFSFKKGSLVRQLKGGILSLAKLIGQMGIASISGNVEASQTPDGWNLYFPPKPQDASRCYVIYGDGATALPNTIALNSITYDVDSAITSALLGTLSGGVFTFAKPGLYRADFTAVIDLDLSGATTATPGQVKAVARLQVDGVDLSDTESGTSATLTPNFDGFVITAGGAPLELGVADLVVETPVLTVDSFVVCDPVPTATNTYAYDTLGISEVFTTIHPTCANALTDTELVDGKLQSTPAAGTSDVTTNAAAITGSTPTGTATGTTCGSALIKVIRDPDDGGALKILDGATKRLPTLSIYGSVTGGSAQSVRGTISILKL